MAKKEAPEREEVKLTPPVDIYDADDEVVLLADMPGVRAEDLEVHLDRGTLTIRGKAEDPATDGEEVVREFRLGEYWRAFTLGEDIDTGKITAELRDGVLSLHLPKVRERKPWKIPVRAE